jgi:transposase
MAMTIVEDARGVTGGVDTHLDVHVAAALDPVGALVGTASFATTPTGYRSLLGWLESFGPLIKVGIEGTGSYGAGLSRFLANAGISVVEVNRPNREERRRSGKSDPLDAIEAARAALSGKAKCIAKSKDGPVEAVRALLVAKRSARTARTSAVIQMRELLVTGPDQLRNRLRGLSISALTREASRLRPGRQGDSVLSATKAALSSLAHRVQALDGELAELDARIEVILMCHWPDLLSLFGVGPDTAAALVVCAGDNAQRLRSEPSWARLCGVAPIPTGSGQTSGRVRLHRGGDRQANAALWRIVMVRIAHHPETTAYYQRKLKEGRSKNDVVRLLKRYVAREVYRHLPRS